MDKSKLRFFLTAFLLLMVGKSDPNVLIDFTKKIEDLIIVTDSTERTDGLSHASITFQDSQKNKSHFFYTHLEPQPNGAAFAGFKVKRDIDASGSQQVSITLKNLSERSIRSQVVITTKDSDNSGFSYKADFNLSENKLIQIKLPLNHFEATRRGYPYPSAPEINLKELTSIGIRLVGRADINLRQKGVFALQIKKITIK